MYRILLTDEKFRELNIPLPPPERRELDARVRKGEALPPVTVWNGFVLSRYEQYDLCLKYHRDYMVYELPFPRRTDAVAWICRKQLERTDLGWQAKSWLISRLYEALREDEKRRQALDRFQYRQLSRFYRADTPGDNPFESGFLLAFLGKEFGCVPQTIRRYVGFGRTLDQLEARAPGIRKRILTGSLEVSVSKVPALVALSDEDLRKLAEDERCRRFIPPPDAAAGQKARPESRRKKEVRLVTGIKQMPSYDPDAELNGLNYTLGAWIKTVHQACEKKNFRGASAASRERLSCAAGALIQNLGSLRRMLEETSDE